MICMNFMMIWSSLITISVVTLIGWTYMNTRKRPPSPPLHLIKPMDYEELMTIVDDLIFRYIDELTLEIEMSDSVRIMDIQENVAELTKKIYGSLSPTVLYLINQYVTEEYLMYYISIKIRNANIYTISQKI